MFQWWHGSRRECVFLLPPPSFLFLIKSHSPQHVCHFHGCDVCWWEQRGRSSSTSTVKPPVSCAVPGHGTPAHRYCGSAHKDLQHCCGYTGQWLCLCVTPETHTTHTNHPTTVTWVKHLSCCPGFMSQQWESFHEAVHLPAAWVEKAHNNSASEAHLFKQSIFYEDSPLKNRCPLAWGKAINAQNYVLNQELICMTGQGSKERKKKELQFINIFPQLPGSLC